MPLQKQVRRLYLLFASFTWLLGAAKRTVLTYAKPQRGFKYCYTLFQASRCKLDLTIARETDTRQLLMQNKLHVERRTGLMCVDM